MISINRPRRSALYLPATNAKAVAKASTLPADVIILDLMLPKMSGLDLLREIRAAGVMTPVVLLTALSSVQDRITGLKPVPRPAGFLWELPPADERSFGMGVWVE